MWIDPSWDSGTEDVVRNATTQGAVMRFATILEGGVVQVHNEAPLSVAPPGLVPQPYIAGKTVAVLRFKGSTLVIGYVGGAGSELVAGVDYQTPLVAGTDYQTPLAVTKPNLAWTSQNGFSLIGYNTMTSMYGRMVTINVHQKVPTAGYSLGAYAAVISGVVGATAYRPDAEVTFAWRTFANQVGIGSFNTSGQVVINSGPAVTLTGDTTLMYTINFIKP